MASKQNWDFNCPQYVNFLADTDNNSDDIYFDCHENHSPLDGRVCKNSPVPQNGLTEEAENKLINKMSTALSVIENTPKLKMGVVRGKLFTDRAPSKNAGFSIFKSAVKPSTVPPERRRSKSVCVGNKIHTDKLNRVKESRPKRSSSLTDLRTIKKHTYPKTPLCLKRTIMNAKTKVFKTTEEMELEQIAELQKQLTQLLRNNEISYKKLKQRQKPCVQKNIENKPDNTKGNTEIITEKNTRRKFHMLNHTAMKRETMKLDSIMNATGSSSIAPKNIHSSDLEKSKNASVSSGISKECDTSKDQMSKKPIKYGFHSGIAFHGSFKKCIAVKPFNFEDKMKDQNAGSGQKAEVSLVKSVSKHTVNNDKENFPVTKAKSILEKLAVLNIRSDIKVMGSNKKIVVQHLKNPVKGSPLAENSLRR